MYKITIWFKDNTYKEFDNIKAIRHGISPASEIFTDLPVEDMRFDDSKPLYLFDGNKNHLVPAKSFKYLSVEKLS